ncbi:MAG TPA: CARDB domain-containing protein [Phycisphaerales bacterium]|nr:CARDB domain-containing protein [Phycisphaerales bacterium]
MPHARETPFDSFGLHPLENRILCAADLVAGGLSMLSTGAAGSGAVVRPFALSVANAGSTGVPAGVQVRYYLSRDAVLDSADRPLRTSVLPDAIPAGERVSYSKFIKLPLGIDSGNYRLLMQVDPNNRIAESDESNNVLPSNGTLGVTFQPHIDSIEVSKRYVRPGSIVTLTARNVTNMDPDAGVVKFYIQPDAIQIYSNPPVLLGIGTRSGNDYTLTFTADGARGYDDNYFVASAEKNGGTSYSTVSQKIEGRNAGPTVGSISFTPAPLIRGQSATLTVSGVSSNARSVELYFDTNLDGLYQRQPFIIPSPGNPDYDRSLASATQSGSTWAATFTVPDWFPSAPTRVFVVLFRQGTFASRVFPVLLTASN